MTAAAQAVLLSAAKRGAKAPLYPCLPDYTNSESALVGGMFYVMDFVASRKTANLTGAKAGSWLE
jgi:hypothetical protein